MLLLIAQCYFREINCNNTLLRSAYNFYPIISLDWLSDFPGKPGDNANVVNAAKQENQETANKASTVKVSEGTALRAPNIRKTSISMPSKLNEMDDLRIDRQNVS